MLEVGGNPGGSAMPIGPENTQPTAGELALEIALRLPRDPDEARAVLDMARELYAAFSNSTGTGAEVIELRPDQHSE
jgi:hypothetical protein